MTFLVPIDMCQKHLTAIKKHTLSQLLRNLFNWELDFSPFYPVKIRLFLEFTLILVPTALKYVEIPRVLYVILIANIK